MRKLKLLSISLLLLLFSKNIHAQYLPIITPDKKWVVENGSFSCPGPNGEPCFCYDGYSVITVGELGFFNEKEYYKIENTYLREEGKKIFFYSEHCEKEYLFYDFDLNVADEIIVAEPRLIGLYGFPCELEEFEQVKYLTYKVTEVDSIEYNHVKRKRLKLDNLVFQSGNQIWVEGIGSMGGIIYYSVLMIGGVTQLKEVYKADELIFVNENPKYCWGYNAINDVSQDLIKIFIDETKVLHILNAENIQFNIYDLQGRKIKSFLSNNNSYQKNISFLSKGLYIISDEKNINFKVIVK